MGIVCQLELKDILLKEAHTMNVLIEYVDDNLNG